MVELIAVIILMGVLGAIGVSRFFDNTIFENRAYADQARSIIRYAQKLAIAQNRPIFVRNNGNSFAVCSNAACDANQLVGAPGGSNSGSAAARANCLSGATYVAAWMCEGRPAAVAVAGGVPLFSFDALGRPSIAASMTLTFSSGGNSTTIVVWPETGYVQ